MAFIRAFRSVKQRILILFISLSTAACIPDNFKKHSEQQFGDQHFKTAIALIELHKLREGEYPPSLDSLKFIGEWDKVIYHAVTYKKLTDGYELNLKNGLWDDEPPQGLTYPRDFWKGLGLKKSNMKH